MQLKNEQQLVLQFTYTSKFPIELRNGLFNTKLTTQLEILVYHQLSNLFNNQSEKKKKKKKERNRKEKSWSNLYQYYLWAV